MRRAAAQGSCGRARTCVFERHPAPPPRPAHNAPGPALAPAQFPPDLPASCPFELDWRPAACVVWVQDRAAGAALRDALRKLQVLQPVAVADLAARLDAADPLAAEAAACEAAHAAAGGAPESLW
jgi:hypothetical protein